MLGLGLGDRFRDIRLGVRIKGTVRVNIRFRVKG